MSNTEFETATVGFKYFTEVPGIEEKTVLNMYPISTVI